MQAREIIDRLALKPHPEGGWYREIHRSHTRVDTARGSRAALTTIYYLLERGAVSRWHVVDADEVWHFYSGSALELLCYEPGSRVLRRFVLAGPAADVEPVATIEAGSWQAARSLGDYSLVGCSVGPGFEFADFRFVATLPHHAEHFSGALAPLAELL
jgi:predicted cupin superfamily sugar epimerase